MDLGLLFGFLGTWAIVCWAILTGGDFLVFIDMPSTILVMGGTFGIMFFAFPVGHLKKLAGICKRSLRPDNYSVEKLIEDMVSYAEVARRDGILSLENITKDIEDQFIVRGIRMAVDGSDPELIDQIMSSELDNLATRHETAKAMLDAMSKYAPAMGLIGTLIGLVIMLQNMNDPSKLGPGMAVAILTTLYGAFVANMLAGPLADRLARSSGEEILYKTIIIKGVMAIQSGDNPRIVEQKLRTFLPPGMSKAGEAKDEAA